MEKSNFFYFSFSYKEVFMRSIVYNSSLKTELGTIFITANEKELLGIHFVTLAPS